MDLAGQLRLQARANRLANHRLHAAMAALGDDEFHAPRVVFFRSLAATLNHVLPSTSTTSARCVARPICRRTTGPSPPAATNS